MQEFIHNVKNEDGTTTSLTFKYVEYKDLKDSDFPIGERKDNTKEWYTLKGHHYQNEYADLGCGFDIETSKIPGTNLSTMYVWQFSIDNLTIIGRTWDEFNELLQRIHNVYHLSEDKKLLVWIHNEKFEFSFLKKQVKWNYKEVKVNGVTVDVRPDIFALKGNCVIKATTKYFIEFRDSLVLTQLSLGKLAKDYNLGIQKLKGELDYSLTRHSLTELTNEEIAYCINDVQILSAFYHKYIYPVYIKNELKIPLTMTGIVRDELKREFLKLPESERKKYKARIKKLMPETFEDYDTLCNEVYRGGYNHANKLYAGEEISIENYHGFVDPDGVHYPYFDMGSFDFKSSYPAVMLHEKYPWELKEKDTDLFYTVANNKRWCKYNAYYGKFIIHDIKNKLSHSLESKNKILEYSDDAIFDNGRLISASWIIVWLTEQDVLNYFDFYTVDDLSQWECLKFYTGIKEDLPKFLKDMVLKYFALKEQLPKGTIEYAIAKAKLNSLYGMIVTSLVYNDTKFDVESGEFVDGYCKKDYSEQKGKTILLPQWGVWVTAFARRNLVKTFAILGDEAMYGDTDSAKVVHVIGNQWIFDAYNDNIRRMNKTMYVGDFDRKLFRNIGIFDYEGKIWKFKTLGCKKYVHSEVEYNKKENKYELNHNCTVSGLVKGSLQNYCKKNNKDVYEAFDYDLKLDNEYSDKLRTVSCNEEFEMELTDYKGVTTIVREKSCCTLVDTTFSFTDGVRDYLNYMSHIVNTEYLTGRRYI